MCGIVGILGKHQVAPLMVEALKRLEYRGYDSAGIATLDNGTLDRRRATGKLINLSDLLVTEPLAGLSGIGHTRWATHGKPTQANAHPHQAGRVAVVHNGIIENFSTLRAELEAGGATFQTETDTEVVVHLCDSHLRAGKTPLEAARLTLARLHGAFALVFLFAGQDDLLIAARRGSPLAIGYGEGEAFVGSDALALAPLTNRIAYLEEGDHAVITRNVITVYDEDNAEVQRKIETTDLDHLLVDKGRFKHFMAKEIHEQPAVLADALARYTDPSTGRIDMETGLDISRFDRVVLVACGTAHYACHVAKYWFEDLLRLPVEIEVASEFRYREPPLNERTLGIFVSQSGETADTLAALRYVRAQGGMIVSMVNVDSSTIARESDLALPILAGPEIGVASTKAFACQLLTLAAFAISTASRRGTITGDREAKLVRALRTLPELVTRALELEPTIADLSREVAKATDVLFLGRGTMFPIALEGALKLKEISYIHAEGYASGELKHGPIALVDEFVPVVVLAPSGNLHDKSMSNMEEVMARDGKVLLVTDSDGAKAATGEPWAALELPDCAPIVAPILYAIPMQLLSYHCALQKGTDVDQPRNLAKSVTVE